MAAYEHSWQVHGFRLFDIAAVLAEFPRTRACGAQLIVSASGAASHHLAFARELERFPFVQARAWALPPP